MTTKEKMEKLNAAFQKAVDESINSISDRDLEEFLGDQFRENKEQAVHDYQQMISQIRAEMMSSFQKVTQESLIESLISRNVDTSETQVASPEESFNEVLIKIKKAEITELQQGIKMLESEIKKNKDVSGRLRTQMANEIEAINEENLKIRNAAAAGQSGK